MIIGMERAALDRWGNGDPGGFLEISAEDVSYFDPFQDSRIDGYAALTAVYESIRGQVKVDRYEMIRPNVKLVGHAAVLTFNYVGYGKNGKTSRWNCSEVYASREAGWRIIQTHWSLVKPLR